jgi:hypothetical protein
MPKEHGTISGGMIQPSEEIKYPVLTIVVEDIDEALKKIESLAGIVPNMGITTYFKDSEGNVLGLWQAIQTQYSSLGISEGCVVGVTSAFPVTQIVGVVG